MRKCLFSLVTVIFNARARGDAAPMQRAVPCKCTVACLCLLGMHRAWARASVHTSRRLYFALTRSSSLLEIYLPRAVRINREIFSRARKCACPSAYARPFFRFRRFKKSFGDNITRLRYDKNTSRAITGVNNVAGKQNSERLFYLTLLAHRSKIRGSA